MKDQITKMAQLETSWRTTPYIQEACTITFGKFQNVLDQQKTMETVWRGRIIPTHMLLRISILDLLDQLLFVKRYFDLGCDFMVTVYVSSRKLFGRTLHDFSVFLFLVISIWEVNLRTVKRHFMTFIEIGRRLTVQVLLRVWCREDTLWRLCKWAWISLCLCIVQHSTRVETFTCHQHWNVVYLFNV